MQQIVAAILFALGCFMLGMCAGLPLGQRYERRRWQSRFTTVHHPFYGGPCRINESDKARLRDIREGY